MNVCQRWADYRQTSPMNDHIQVKSNPFLPKTSKKSNLLCSLTYIYVIDNAMQTVKQWRVSPFMITILVVWFFANLLSQVVYVAIYGTPYDGVAMLASLGSYYYLILAVELFLWVWLLCYLIVNGIKQVTRNRLKEEIGSIGELSKSTSFA